MNTNDDQAVPSYVDPSTAFTKKPETRDLRAIAAPLLDRALEGLATGEQMWWDLGYAMLPTGPGQMTCHGMLMLSMPNAILGEQPLNFSMVVNPAMLVNEDVAHEAMRQCVDGIRSLMSQMMQQSLANVNANLSRINGGG